MFLLYLRIFAIDRTLRYFIWGGILFNALFYAGFTASATALQFLCTSSGGKSNRLCFNNYKITMVSSAVSVVSDFYVLLVLIKGVLGLKLSNQRKIGVILIFMTGLLYVRSLSDAFTLSDAFNFNPKDLQK